MKFKKFLAVLLAVLMTASFCVPAAAAATYEEYCDCEDPWLENPEYGEWVERVGTNATIYIRQVIWDCTHCGLQYIEYEDYYVPHG